MRKNVAALQGVQSCQCRISDQPNPTARDIERLAAGRTEVFQQTPMGYAGEADWQMPQ
jgi:hypothetical protein